MEKNGITVIGGGLAGCEAAYQISRLGVKATVYEMKPHRFSPAHTNPDLAELVCSNSLRSTSLENAVGLLKEEMRKLKSLVIRAADQTQVPAGGALAVDREKFSRMITEEISAAPGVTLVREEISQLPAQGLAVIATGPLTSDQLAAEIQKITGEEYLYFYDATSPIIHAESINREKVFPASRYDKGGDDYLNCPLSREEYYRLIDAIRIAQKVPYRDFEKSLTFAGCQPIEVLAAKGVDTLAFGCMKPVGLIDPKTGAQSFAVVQLRPENREKSMYSMVGFQTKLTYPEQVRIFRLIPGLEDAEFARLGNLHRNTFINSPRLLIPTLQLKTNPRIFFAGQLTGVEGYVESTAIGLLAGINAARIMQDLNPLLPPPTTALGSLLGHLSKSSPLNFQPMNINWALFPPLSTSARGKSKYRLLTERALRDLGNWSEKIHAGSRD